MRDFLLSGRSGRLGGRRRIERDVGGRHAGGVWRGGVSVVATQDTRFRGALLGFARNGPVYWGFLPFLTPGAMPRTLSSVTLGLAGLLVALGLAPLLAADEAVGVEFFERRVRPVLAE